MKKYSRSWTAYRVLEDLYYTDYLIHQVFDDSINHLIPVEVIVVHVHTVK